MNLLECFSEYRKIGDDVFEYFRGIDFDIRVLRAWDEGGLLALEWNEGLPSRMWLNVIRHQMSVGKLAHGLAKCCEDLLSIEEYDLQTVWTAALIHDSYKRRETEANKVARDTGQSRAESNRKAEHASCGFLRNIGFDEKVIDLASATGDLGLERMMGAFANLGEKIVFYADCCVSGEVVVGYKTRFDNLLPEFEPGGRYEWVNDEYAKKYNGRTHRQVWDEVVIPIQEELANLVGFKGNPKDLYLIAFE